MLSVPSNYDDQGRRNKDRSKKNFFRKPFRNHQHQQQDTPKVLPQVSRQYGKLSHYSMAVIHIGYLRSYFEQEVIEDMKEHALGVEHQEALYDYLVMHSFKEATKDEGIEIPALYRHDIYGMILEKHIQVFSSALKQLLKAQAIKFLHKDEPKLAVMGDIMMVARSFNAVF